jgi:3-oxoadipate enol-lactonase
MASSITSYGTVTCAGAKLFYEQEGNQSGPAVLFVHGLGGTTNAFQPLVGALQDFNLVRFEWAGHGRSSVSNTTSIGTYVDDALGLSFSTLKSAGPKY